MPEALCYLDNAATSFPKPDTVIEAVSRTLKEVGANPGRGGHRLSLEGDRILFEARERIASFFNLPQSKNVVFTKNATESINLALKGLLRPDDHVLVSGMEHNSVMRPLAGLASVGVSHTVVQCDAQGVLDPDALERGIRPETRLIVLTHASNVTGAILPIREVGMIARRHNIPFLLDAAQTAGALDIDTQRDGIDMLACTGHKGLLGPQGIGFLAVGEGIDLSPLIEGGTGSASDSLKQPEFLPDRLESGTQNTPGIVGLSAGLAFIESKGRETIREREKYLTNAILKGLARIKGVKIFGPSDPERRVAVIPFTVSNTDPGELGDLLDSEYGIITRVGLHCSPLAHRCIGTFPQGTVRVSPGFFTTESDIDHFLRSMRKICF